MEDATLEKLDIIRARTGVSYRKAKEALDKNHGNVVEAIIELEEINQEPGKKWIEEFSVRSNEVIDKVKDLIHQGNINKIRVKHDNRTLVEIPVGLGAIGAVVLPQLAALGVLVAVFKHCTIEVIHSEHENLQDKQE